MKITMIISDGMAADLSAFTGKTEAGEAILAALEDYVLRQRMADSAKYLGTFEDFMTGAELAASRI